MKVALHTLSLSLLLAASLLPLQVGAQCGYTFEHRLDWYETTESDLDWVTLEDAMVQYPATSGSQATTPIPIGFTFRYFGEEFSSVTVTASAKICFEGFAPGIEEMYIGSFLDNYPLAGGGYLLHKTLGSPGARKFVMEFHSQACTTQYGPVLPLCWQVHLCEDDMSVRILLYGTENRYIYIKPIQLSGRREDRLFVYPYRGMCTTDDPLYDVGYLPFDHRKEIICLVPNLNCWHPTELTLSQLTDSAVTVSWRPVQGAVRYEVKFSRQGVGTLPITSTTQSSIRRTGLLPGTIYQVWVRAECANGEYSDWMGPARLYTYCSNAVEDPFRYWDLYDTAVSCRIGHSSTPSTREQVVDYGSDAMVSRHTVHSDPTERDPRTGNLLRTVPEGYCYSVRLGNWSAGSEQEEVVYRLQVDTGKNDLLLLRYALVEQNPQHPADQQPHFILSVRNQRGDLLNSCLYANFVAGDRSGWNTSSEGGDSDVLWRDWMAVGVDLSPYHGQEIYVHLSNSDCAQGGHYGYAYYVMETGTKRLTSTSCGEMVTNTFSAPPGFAYRWYNADNPSVTLSTSRRLYVTTAGNYCCRVTYLHTTADCGFTLTARTGSRYPVAAFTMSPRNSCGSEVYFVNQSRVAADSARQNITNEPCESYLWQFDDGTTSTLPNPTHTFQGEGLHTVTLTAMLANGTCTDTYTDSLRVTYSRDTVYDTVCPGMPYRFYRYLLYDSGFYTAQEVCGFHWLHLSYHDTSSSTRYDTICMGDTLRLYGREFVDAGTHRIVFPDVRGCDSSVYLHLKVHPTYFVRIKDTLPVGEYLTVEDTQFVAPALGGYTMETVEGCDSTLWVRLSCIKTEDSTACVDALPLTWGNATFADEGTDTSYFKSKVGTDSIHVRVLHVRQHAAPTLRAVPYCDTPQYYIVTLPVAGYTYRWSSQPPLEPLLQQTGDSLLRLYLRPTEETRLLFVYDYADAPSCPGGDTVTLFLQRQFFLHLDVQPETLTTDNLHLVARDLGDNVYFRQWVVDSVLQTQTGARMEYEAPTMADSVVVVLIGGDSVCVDTARRVIPVIKEDLFFPNVFTPGRDDNNSFLVFGTEVDDFELWIYDRRGVLVFHTNDRAEGWDGTCNGIPCPQGAYAYVCHYSIPDNQYRTRAGTVTLLR